MATLSYDLIVLGDDLAGLYAAALCASRGMRVLLAEPHKATASYRLGKESVPVAPFVLSGLQRPGVERVIAELNFDHLMRRRLVPRNPPFQILGPRLRLELHPDSEKLGRALNREAGVNASWLRSSEPAQEALDALLSEGICMPGTGFWERRELGKRMPDACTAANSWDAAEHSETEELLSQSCHLTLGGAGETFARARSVANLLQGVPRLAGDASAWRNLFLEKLQAHSGEHRVLVPEAIETSWGKVSGLRSVDDEIRCDHLIAAMPVQELAPLLNAKASKKLNQGVLPTVSAYRYTLNLLVHASALPEGLSDLAASTLDADESPIDGNYALFSTRPAASQGRAIVSIGGFAAVAEDGSADVSGLREALLAHAELRMPFLKTHTEMADSPHEPAQPGVKRDLVAPLAPKPVWNSPIDDNLGICALPFASGVKHLWIASEQTLPELGPEGQFIAAHGVAKLACAGAGKGKGSSKPSVLAGAGQ